MAEYIEFEATKQAIDRIRSVYHRARNFNAVSVIDNVFGEIKEIPAADVAPVVHGRWRPIRNVSGFVACDKCGCWCGVKSNFCPNCGAKMDIDEEGET